MLRIPSWNAAISGAATLLVAAYTIWEALSLPLGQVSRMGPGYFPLMLGIVMAGLGALLLFQPDGPPDTLVEAPSLRGFVGIIGGMTAFALLLRTAGLVPAITALVVISAFSERDAKPMNVAAIALLLIVICVAIFIYGLGVPMHAVIAWWR